MSRKRVLRWLQERGLDGKTWVERGSAARKGFPAPHPDLRHSSRPDPTPPLRGLGDPVSAGVSPGFSGLASYCSPLAHFPQSSSATLTSSSVLSSQVHSCLRPLALACPSFWDALLSNMVGSRKVLQLVCCPPGTFHSQKLPFSCRS